MRFIKYFRNILLLSCLIFLSSCSKKEESTPIPVLPTPITTVTNNNSKSLYWLDWISKSEDLWVSSKINSYEIVGRVSWAWHEHSFQITVRDGEVVNSKCESTYDNLTNDKWCETVFKANNYLIPAIFEKARELIKRGDEMTNSQDDCFYARFDYDIGVPISISFDCPKANDEEEAWEIIFFRNTP